MFLAIIIIFNSNTRTCLSQEKVVSSGDVDEKQEVEEEKEAEVKEKEEVKEYSDILPASPENIHENMKQKFLMDLPRDFYQFFEFCKVSLHFFFYYTDKWKNSFYIFSDIFSCSKSYENFFKNLKGGMIL